MIGLIPSYHDTNQDFGEINLYIHKIENERLHRYVSFINLLHKLSMVVVVKRAILSFLTS